MNDTVTGRPVKKNGNRIWVIIAVVVVAVNWLWPWAVIFQRGLATGHEVFQIPLWRLLPSALLTAALLYGRNSRRSLMITSALGLALTTIMLIYNAEILPGGPGISLWLISRDFRSLVPFIPASLALIQAASGDGTGLSEADRNFSRLNLLMIKLLALGALLYFLVLVMAESILELKLDFDLFFSVFPSCCGLALLLYGVWLAGRNRASQAGLMMTGLFLMILGGALTAVEKWNDWSLLDGNLPFILMVVERPAVVGIWLWATAWSLFPARAAGRPRPVLRRVWRSLGAALIIIAALTLGLSRLGRFEWTAEEYTGPRLPLAVGDYTFQIPASWDEDEWWNLFDWDDGWSIVFVDVPLPSPEASLTAFEETLEKYRSSQRRRPDRFRPMEDLSERMGQMAWLGGGVYSRRLPWLRLYIQQPQGLLSIYSYPPPAGGETPALTPDQISETHRAIFLDRARLLLDGFRWGPTGKDYFPTAYGGVKKGTALNGGHPSIIIKMTAPKPKGTELRIWLGPLAPSSRLAPRPRLESSLTETLANLLSGREVMTRERSLVLSGRSGVETVVLGRSLFQAGKPGYYFRASWRSDNSEADDFLELLLNVNQSDPARDLGLWNSLLEQSGKAD